MAPDAILDRVLFGEGGFLKRVHDQSGTKEDSEELLHGSMEVYLLRWLAVGGNALVGRDVQILPNHLGPVDGGPHCPRLVVGYLDLAFRSGCEEDRVKDGGYKAIPSSLVQR